MINYIKTVIRSSEGRREPPPTRSKSYRRRIVSFVRKAEKRACTTDKLLCDDTGPGVESKLCMFYGENHGLSQEGKPSNRISRLSEILHWMEEHLKEE